MYKFALFNSFVPNSSRISAAYNVLRLQPKLVYVGLVEVRVQREITWAADLNAQF